MSRLKEMFGLSGKVAAVTGGGGVLCGTMGKALAAEGAKVALLDLKEEAAQGVAAEIERAGGRAAAVKVDVLDRGSVERALARIVKELGGIDILVNGAGGNHKSATTSPQMEFFDIPPDAVQFVFNLNFIGTLLPCQVFGKEFARKGRGNIVNVSSMNADRPLTKVCAYSAAKAAVSNFPRWLAVHMSQNYSKEIRVNAIAPGFFLTEQNRFLLTDEKTGALTARGEAIVAHTPMAKFGEPEDLVGTLIWLLSPAASFVHGTVIPVDGGFSAFSGV